MSVPKFDPSEIENPVFEKDRFGKETHLFKTPCPTDEAFRAMLRKEPYWMMKGMDERMFTPQVVPDNCARALSVEARRLAPEQFGGKDMFGIDWEFVPAVGGSMVRPGNPFATDANELLEKLVWPDPDAWDWEGAAAANKDYFQPGQFYVVWFFTGWYERLISFMEFENAIMALYDEDQQDAVRTLFDRLSDLYIKIFDKYIQYFPQVSSFLIHDDWGSQKETFFSPALAEEMIVPAMRKVTDYLHSRGKVCELHSCGMNMKQVPNFIKAGWDIWQGQPMNDTHALYEQYGDQIILGVYPKSFDVNAPEEVQRAAARKFVDDFMKPGKPCILNYNDKSLWTLPFMDELYAYSRQRACGMV